MPSDKDSLRGVTPYWLAETVRLREDLWGPLEDAVAVRRARGQGNDFASQILSRARSLGEREKLDKAIEKWVETAKWTLIGLLLMALLAGATTAAGALGDGTRSVNVLLALTALLGLHVITFVFWLTSWRIGTSTPGTWLGRSWMWLTRKLARGPDAGLVPTAFVMVLSRAHTLRWTLAAVSHAVWVTALTGALLTLLALLSARYYSFNWETTLLSADTFVRLTLLIGWLPSKFGFGMPTENIIRASDTLHTLGPEAQTLWSSWLIGATVVYGLVPRLLALGLSVAIVRRRLRNLTLDTSHPSYARLRMRLQPASERTGTDALPGTDHSAQVNPATPRTRLYGYPVIAGLELGDTHHWPPPGLPSTPTHDAGLIDSLAERNALLDNLHDQPAGTLILVCDGRQTPDRGIIAFIRDLSDYAHRTHIVLISPDTASSPHAAWTQRLSAVGIMPDHIHRDFSSASTWLSATHDP